MTPRRPTCVCHGTPSRYGEETALVKPMQSLARHPLNLRTDPLGEHGSNLCNHSACIHSTYASTHSASMGRWVEPLQSLGRHPLNLRIDTLGERTNAEQHVAFWTRGGLDTAPHQNRGRNPGACTNEGTFSFDHSAHNGQMSSVSLEDSNSWTNAEQDVAL